MLSSKGKHISRQMPWRQSVSATLMSMTQRNIVFHLQIIKSTENGIKYFDNGYRLIWYFMVVALGNEDEHIS